MKKQVSSHSAVLIFTGSAVADSRRKGFGDQAAFFEYLTQLTIDKVVATGISYHLHAESQQRGTTFGARLQHAIQNLFDQGFEKVIAIGNDAPQLNAQHLSRSLELLNQGHTVLGPSQDGGFYLLGIHKLCFNRLLSCQQEAQNTEKSKSNFQQLPWCTSGLLRALNHLLHDLEASVRSLETLADVDNFSDARNILRAPGITRSFKRVLIFLLSRKRISLSSIPTIPTPVGYDFYFTRGSPNWARPLI